jgi:hypothetical protein
MPLGKPWRNSRNGIKRHASFWCKLIVSVMGENKKIQKNINAVLNAGEEVGLEVKAVETECMFMRVKEMHFNIYPKISLFTHAAWLRGTRVHMHLIVHTVRNAGDARHITRLNLGSRDELSCVRVARFGRPCDKTSSHSCRGVIHSGGGVGGGVVTAALPSST